MKVDSTSLTSKVNSGDLPGPHRSAVTQFIFSHIQIIIAASLTGVFLLFGSSTWNIWQLYQGFELTVEQELKLQDLSRQIIYYDEVLSMSARMSASTANPKWESRYWMNEPKLSDAIEAVNQLVPTAIQSQTAQTDAANQRLIEIREQAFSQVKSGQNEEALALLLSPEYEQQKEIYSQGIQQTIDLINQEGAKLQAQYKSKLEKSLAFAGLSLPLLIFSIAIVIGLVRTYFRDRQQAELALKQSQQSLLASNNELTEKVQFIELQTQQIRSQERKTAQESELLQQDIGMLLEVFAELGEGNFMVEATVTNRVTGLVADTLNRLIEELSQTLAQVSGTANIASESAREVKVNAEQVAIDVNEQAEGVKHILGLTETVWQSAQDAIAQVEETQAILCDVKTSVEQGQGAIIDMNSGIDELQSGSDRMVQKIKTLGEFVSLADQFVQEQNQTAELTQILALNASLVAAKASERQDPDRFQQVAQEFESIANQVQQLAQQTNRGLDILHKRTTKIHDVVADVDRDVQGVNHLVKNFSQGVSKSTAAFSAVQRKTVEVETYSQAVERGNMNIVAAAENTRLALYSIAKQAERTTERMQATLQSSKQMKTIASQLTESVQVFTLPMPVAPVKPGVEPSSNPLTTPPGADSEKTAKKTTVEVKPAPPAHDPILFDPPDSFTSALL